jgi:hypothetical protein
MKQTKQPARRICCDGLKVEAGGVVYHPHADEYVEFVGGPSWSFMRDAALMTQLESRPFNTLNAEESRAMIATLDRLVEFLASRISSWTWTGPDGEPLPEPTREVLGGLEQAEVLWLIQALVAGDAPEQAEEAEKNA